MTTSARRLEVHPDRPVRGLPTCNAPGASMYLDPTGTVTVCCQNTTAPLGSIRTASLRQLWDGPVAVELRARMAAGDLSLGCQECERTVDAGRRDAAYLVTFDHLGPVPADGLAWPRRLELALSNTCNLQCEMCNGDLSSAIRAQREHRSPMVPAYDDTFFHDLVPFLEQVEEISFLGGEPLLATETWRVVDLLRDLGRRPRCLVTTNGTVWNGKVERLLAEVPWTVIVSVDGADADTFESIRIGASFDRVVENVGRFVAASRTGDGQVDLAHCLMPKNAEQLPHLLAWADGLDVDVTVNDVGYPTRFSLAGLDADRLQALLDAWVATAGRDGSGLGRNRRVLQAQVARVEGLLAVADAPGLLGWPPMDLPRRGTPGHDDTEGTARLDAWVGTAPVEHATIEAAPGGIVTRVQAPASFGLSDPTAVGKPIDEAFTSVMHALGGMRTARQLDRTVDLLEFEDEMVDGVLRATISALRDQQGTGTAVRVHIAFRRT